MANQNEYLTELHQLLVAHFNTEELKTLCFTLDVAFDDLPGATRADKARELVLYLNRHNQLTQFEGALRKLRPDIVRPQPLPPELTAEIVGFLAALNEFFLSAERRDKLTTLLPDWPGFVLIDWHGSPHNFFNHLVYRLPDEQIKQLLWSLLIDTLGEQQVTRLCAEIDAAAVQQKSASVTDRLHPYHNAIVVRLSAPDYQIDRRFVQMTLLLDQGPDAQGLRFTPDKQHGRFDSLQTLLDEVKDRALVLLGGPGSGKTTLLRRLQLERAWAELKAPTGHTTFFMPLNAYRGLESGAAPPEPFDWLAAEWQLRHPDLPPFETLFKNGRFLLLLDGLNEMPHGDKTEYRRHIGRWQSFLQRTHHVGNTVIFSCRSLDYSAPLGSEAVPVRQVQVEPLSPQQIHAFLTAYLGAAGDSVWTALQAEAQLELYANPFYLRLLTEEVSATGQRPSGRAALLTSFVRRALRREVERRHPLFEPDNLLSEGDYLQVLHRAWANDPNALPEEGLLIPHLTQLAYKMQADRAANTAGQVRLPEPQARALLAHVRAQDILAAGMQLHLLDKDLATREVTFYHQLVQEYFAARLLARVPEPERVRAAWRADEVTPALAETVAALEVSEPLPALPATGWEETTLLAAAMALDQNDFVAGLRATNLVLAARCAAAPEVAVPQLVTALQKALLARIGDPQADLRARIAAAEALGDLGDPRFERRSGPHGDYLLPPLVSIPAGKYTVGDDNSQYADEKPAHQVDIAAFEISVFPVTNAEYALFIKAGGYHEEGWWQTEAAKAWRRGEGGNEGIKRAARDQQAYLQDFSDEVIREQNVSPDQIEFWLWLKHASSETLEKQYDKWYPTDELPQQPAYWDDSRFNHPAQPVVGISWYEARAYCVWLSAQSGELFRLPSEVEWEAAARGIEGRQYAYGPAFDATRCNTFETHIRRTTPVGVFPGGYTPEGIADLSGNIWEWTTTLWGESIQRPTFVYPYAAEDGREEPENATARRVVRGGSWYDFQGNVRAAFRSHNFPGARSLGSGFRVALVRRSPSQ